jgi:DNA-binding NtrC family response regulator
MEATTPNVPISTLLIVDDEPLMTQILSLQMTKNGFRTLVADNVNDALNIIDSGEPSVDFVLTDMSMPELTGLDLANAMCQRQLDIPVFIASGYPADETAALPSNVVGFAEKPFQYKSLAERIRQILDSRR